MEGNKENNMEMDDIVTLLDDEGKELSFQHIMTFDHKDNTYVVLVPAEEMEDIEEDEAVILRIEQDEDGNDVYATVTDEDELESAFNRYLEIAESDEYTVGDEEEDE